jgi:Helicase conserved C-terminal domain
MSRREQREQSTNQEAYQRLTLDQLRPLGRLIDEEPPARKRELVPLLADAMARPATVRRLYEALDATAKAAVREATYDPAGRVDPARFEAKYGRLPDFGPEAAPTPLRLFLPRDWRLPADVGTILKTFAPEPPPAAVAARDDLPESVPLAPPSWGRRRGDHKSVPLRHRATAEAAGQEIRAALRLVEAGRLRVTEKTRRPTTATVEAVRGVLPGGDFYDPEDREASGGDPASDLAIRAYAWPLLLQAAGLADVSGEKLVLSDAGRKALGQDPHAVLRAAWKEWVGTTLFDEFHRIDAIRGQRRAGLTPAANRRRVVIEALGECPVGRWVAVDDFLRYLRASGRDFEVAREVWELYIAEPGYGSLGYDAEHAWEQVQGRFVLAFLFECAATLGLLDVAYVPPRLARDDFYERWGADEFTCLSRYDGLKFFRINALGAWSLGLAEEYRPEPPPSGPAFRVLANLDVVAVDGAQDPADVLLLGRVAERTSDAAWKLSREKLLTAVEGGLNPDDLGEFLAARSAEPLPQAVRVLLADLRERSGRLRDHGLARLVECADVETARSLAHDRSLRSLCMLAGDRHLVFSAGDEAAVRKRLRKIGFVLPPRE